MPLTPADIHHAEFGKAPLGRRGYDEEQVDALLDEVSQEMVELLDEREVLHRRAGRAETSTARPDPGEDLRAELAAVTAALESARHECDRAEQRARLLQRQLEEARQLAAARLAAAPVAVAVGENPGIVMAMAQRTADDHLHEARRQSHALAAEARAQSERVTGEAMRRVQDIEEDTHRRQLAAAAELETGNAALRRQVEELTSFAESYRAALAEHLRVQSQSLDVTD